MGFRDQIHISNHPECKSDDVHFFSYLEHPTWKEKGEYFQILLPMTKIQSGETWHDSTGHDFVRLSFDCYGAGMLRAERCTGEAEKTGHRQGGTYSSALWAG